MSLAPDAGRSGYRAASINSLAALKRQLDTLVTVVVGDNAVRAVHTLAPGRVGVKDLQQWTATPGAGGTDFTLEEAARHRPPGALLWAVPPGADETAIAAAPFGRVLRLR